MIFSWETHGMGFPKAIINFKNSTDESVPYEVYFFTIRRASIHACRGKGKQPAPTKLKVSVKPFQRLAESKGGALVADRSQRNTLIHQNRRKGEKIFRRMIFSWETHGMGFPKAIINFKKRHG